MMFILRMAAREIRSSWQRLLFFFVCIAVGVAAIIALRSVIQSVRAGMSQQAQVLIASDILLTSNREFTSKVLDTIAAEQRSGRVGTVLSGASGASGRTVCRRRTRRYGGTSADAAAGGGVGAAGGDR